MNFRLALALLGRLLLFLAAVLLLPILVSLLFGDGAHFSFLVSSVLCAACGFLLVRRFHSDRTLTVREGFGLVTFSWIAFSIFGGLPFLHVMTSPVDAFFESMSGFTTTGSTILTDLSLVPESILFWRSMTQWLGGMGIIVLSLAILPVLRVGGMQLFEAEVPGPTADRLRPRIRDTAKLLWGVYVVFSVVQVVLLMLGGVSLYEAVCHAFTTMATGGFSTRNGSVGELGGSYVHVVVTVFMFLAGTSFSLHYYALRGRVSGYLKSEEFRFYLSVTGLSVLTLFLMNFSIYDAPLTNLRDAAFQVVSLMTTTGFGTADYEMWPAVSQYVLVSLMFLGGCAGSTGGGIKSVRILLILKHALLQISRLIHPRQVRVLKIDHRPVSDSVIQGVLGFFALYVSIFLFASLAMAALGLDLVTAGASVIACLSNIGPGLGDVGPTDTFAGLPALGKVVLSLCMLVGRLEVFTVLVLVFPSFWRR